MAIDTLGAAKRGQNRPRFAASRVECACRSFGFGRVLTLVRSKRGESKASAAQRNGTPDVPAVIGSISA
jgi:hypothetical protein